MIPLKHLDFGVMKQVFVANPNKPLCIKEVLVANRQELLKLLNNLPASKGRLCSNVMQLRLI
jgi:hypothetical protein